MTEEYKQLYEQVCEQYDVLAKVLSDATREVAAKDEALDLALEALTPFSTPNWAGTGVDKANEAIAAIKQARSVGSAAI